MSDWVGGRLTGTRWVWYSKRARLRHRLAIRLGLMEPPVVRPSVYVIALYETMETNFKKLLDMEHEFFTRGLQGKTFNFDGGYWDVKDAEYSPIWGKEVKE